MDVSSHLFAEPSCRDCRGALRLRLWCRSAGARTDDTWQVYRFCQGIYTNVCTYLWCIYLIYVHVYQYFMEYTGTMQYIYNIIFIIYIYICNISVFCACNCMSIYSRKGGWCLNCLDLAFIVNTKIAGRWQAFISQKMVENSYWPIP